MKGGIYSDGRCPVCGSVFTDNGKALICLKHKEHRAQAFKVKFGGLTKRFKSYELADRFLTGVRFKTDEEIFDERDYKKDNPLGFANMSAKWLEYKRNEVRKGSFRPLRSHVRYAQDYFKNKNVKEIRFAELEDFIKSPILKTLSDKTRHNILSTVHAFFTWMKMRQEIPTMPNFPSVSFDLGYRKTIDKELQQQIIQEAKRIFPNPKIYLAFKWLSTYISLRPGELRKLTEGNIDTANGYLYIPAADSKTVYKSIPLIDEDIEIFKSFGKSAVPNMPFFRHNNGSVGHGAKMDQPFGEGFLYSCWIKTCESLGVKGVDLYGGTRHSSVRALRKYRSPEEIKRAAMSETNKAFERYMGKDTDGDFRSIYRESAQVLPIKAADPVLTLAKST